MRIMIIIAISISMLTMSCRSPSDEPQQNPVQKPPTQSKCIDMELQRHSVFWPSLVGTPQCPLPADHPNCINGTEKYCEPASKSASKSAAPAIAP